MWPLLYYGWNGRKSCMRWVIRIWPGSASGMDPHLAPNAAMPSMDPRMARHGQPRRGSHAIRGWSMPSADGMDPRLAPNSLDPPLAPNRSPPTTYSEPGNIYPQACEEVRRRGVVILKNDKQKSVTQTCSLYTPGSSCSLPFGSHP